MFAPPCMESSRHTAFEHPWRPLLCQQEEHPFSVTREAQVWEVSSVLGWNNFHNDFVVVGGVEFESVFFFNIVKHNARRTWAFSETSVI